MKVITLHQPWAWAIAEGHKTYETRSWKTSYRGLIAIHAGRHWDVATRDWTQMTARKLGIEVPEMLPLGAVLCVCELKAIYRAEELFPHLGTKEAALGNYEAGRFAWRLELKEVFEPIFTPGKQGLKDCNLLHLPASEPSYGKV